MIILAAQLDSILQAQTATNIVTNPLSWYCSFQYLPPNTVSYYSLVGQNIFGATPVQLTPTLSTTPPPSQQILILELTIFNTDTAPATVTITINSITPGLTATLYNCVLAPGETLSYNPTPGTDGSWNILDIRGNAR